ncbi:DUF382-domain-containing protein [Martensiomyces pterosporus]|nr:DUF382-domain-containing protein [Martensiomyces pterosporus]
MKEPVNRPSTANKRRKKKSRKEKHAADEARSNRLASLYAQKTESEAEQKVPVDVTIEYVEAPAPDLESTDFAAYAQVFSQFNSNAEKSFGTNEEGEEQDQQKEAETAKQQAKSVRIADETRPDLESSDSEQSDDADDQANGSLSRKQRKRSRMSVAELKQQAQRPEVVEWTDISARDPGLLVSLKAARNTVPVPSHWAHKKKYLQYKRGMEKPPFELPDFIKATGIAEMREAVKEKEDEKKAKTTARERTRPKMNKLTLDYQRLHDAFFRFQTPPKNMTTHGDLFYEGKESDTTFNFTPSMLSETLKTALNMPPLAPPPWLINMQRYGPPPSYPNLVVPGLNAPIPQGAQWGYHPGGWGRPPVDEFGRPLYGDVFAANTLATDSSSGDGAQGGGFNSTATGGPRKYWGSLEQNESSGEESEGEEEEEEEEEESGDEAEQRAAATEDAESNRAALTDEQARSRAAAMPSGLETPDVVQLRKRAAGPGASDADRPLYTILPEQATTQLEGIVGSQYTYDVSVAFDPSKKAAKAGTGGRKSKPMGKGVDIALDASELAGLDQETLQAKYEEAAMQDGPAGAGGVQQEDLSDMVAEHAAMQARKRKANAPDSSSKKKAKDFKF